MFFPYSCSPPGGYDKKRLRAPGRKGTRERREDGKGEGLGDELITSHFHISTNNHGKQAYLISVVWDFGRKYVES